MFKIQSYSSGLQWRIEYRMGRNFFLREGKKENRLSVKRNRGIIKHDNVLKCIQIYFIKFTILENKYR